VLNKGDESALENLFAEGTARKEIIEKATREWKKSEN
jgi:hypothetical protein